MGVYFCPICREGQFSLYECGGDWFALCLHCDYGTMLKDLLREDPKN